VFHYANKTNFQLLSNVAPTKSILNFKNDRQEKELMEKIGGEERRGIK
jgi:hypothetical protein